MYGAALMERRALVVTEGVVVNEHALARRAVYVGVCLTTMIVQSNVGVEFDL